MSPWRHSCAWIAAWRSRSAQPGSKTASISPSSAGTPPTPGSRLFRPGEAGPFEEFALHPGVNRTGHIWHVWIEGLPPDTLYAWRMDMRPNPNPAIHRFNPSLYLLDPYARVLVGGEQWGLAARRLCGLPRDHFDWRGDQPLNIPLAETVIYELHVRAYTRHPSSGVSSPGTYLGLTEKIPYLKELGVTAVELMPVYEFEEADTDRVNPFTGERLLNLWGYQPIGFFAPNAAYASPPRPAPPSTNSGKWSAVSMKPASR